MSITINKDMFQVFKNNKPVHTTKKEYNLLVALFDSKKKVMSREKILSQVWGHGDDVVIETRTVDQHVARLRKKFGKQVIRMVPSRGYIFGE